MLGLEDFGWCIIFLLIVWDLVVNIGCEFSLKRFYGSDLEGWWAVWLTEVRQIQIFRVRCGIQSVEVKQEDLMPFV